MIDLHYERKSRRSLMFTMVTSYILLFFLIIGAAAATVFLASRFTTNLRTDVLNQLDDLTEHLQVYGMEEVTEMVLVTPGSFIEVLDEDFRVTAEYNSPNPIGYQYDRNQIYSMAFNDLEELMAYNFYYREEKGDILLYVINEFSSSKLIERILYFAGLVFVLGLFVIIIIYANLISRRMISPINKVQEAVTRITRGEYDQVVEFRSRNEIGDLRDSVNMLARILREEVQRREKAETARQRLILDISHDLKSPLTSVLGYAETLEGMDNLSNEDLKRYLKIILVNGKKANRLIKDLFDLAQMEDLDFELPLETVDLAEFLRLHLAEVIPQLEDLGLVYDFHFPENPVIADIDQQYLGRAMDNLISNYIKYSGKNAHLSCSLSVLGDHCKITVEDNGVGIPANLHDRIFQPFYRFDPSRNSKTGGTGLGLTITRFIIRKHQGDIFLDRQWKDGTRFIIILPLQTPAE